MVLTGSINTELVTLLNGNGSALAVGLSGKDGGLIRARKLLSEKKIAEIFSPVTMSAMRLATSSLRAWGTEHDVDITGVPFYTIAAPINLRDVTFQEEVRQIASRCHPRAALQLAWLRPR